MPARRTTAAVAVLALSAAACGVGEEVDPTAAGLEEDGSLAEDDRSLRFAHVYEPSHPVETCGYAEIDEALDGSGLAVSSYPAAQLGSEAELLEQVASGNLDLAVAGPSFLGVWYERAELLDALYLFEDVDGFVAAVEGPEVTGIWEEMREETGLAVLSSWYYGTRHVTANQPMQEPDDFAGVKLRTPDAPLYLANVEAMGGTATPMELSEVYLALQQGVIDAQENPVPTIVSSGFHEVQDYINLTGHIVQGVMVVTSEDTLASLDDAQQEAITAAVVDAADAVRDCIESEELEVIEEWRSDDAIEVVDDIDREVFVERVREQLLPQFDAWADDYVAIQEG